MHRHERGSTFRGSTRTVCLRTVTRIAARENSAARFPWPGSARSFYRPSRALFLSPLSALSLPAVTCVSPRVPPSGNQSAESSTEKKRRGRGKGERKKKKKNVNKRPKASRATSVPPCVPRRDVSRGFDEPENSQTVVARPRRRYPRDPLTFLPISLSLSLSASFRCILVLFFYFSNNCRQSAWCTHDPWTTRDHIGATSACDGIGASPSVCGAICLGVVVVAVRRPGDGAGAGWRPDAGVDQSDDGPAWVVSPSGLCRTVRVSSRAVRDLVCVGHCAHFGRARFASAPRPDTPRALG